MSAAAWDLHRLLNAYNDLSIPPPEDVANLEAARALEAIPEDAADPVDALVAAATAGTITEQMVEDAVGEMVRTEARRRLTARTLVRCGHRVAECGYAPSARTRWC